jgi:hypothetical protein
MFLVLCRGQKGRGGVLKSVVSSLTIAPSCSALSYKASLALSCIIVDKTEERVSPQESK